MQIQQTKIESINHERLCTVVRFVLNLAGSMRLDMYLRVISVSNSNLKEMILRGCTTM